MKNVTASKVEVRDDLLAEHAPALSRRRFVAGASAAIAATWVGARHNSAEEPEKIVATINHAAATDEVSVVPLRGNISVLMGSGGNIAVLPGPDGKLLIDAGIAVSQRRISDALASLGSDPITQLVNTHWHFDHTGGNAWLHAAGATITAHENTRKRLPVRHRVEGWRFTFPAAPKGALPAITFKKDLTLHFNAARIELEYYEPAHTDCDISVHFTDADVIHVGDTWWNGVYPFTDYSSGGNIDGVIAATEVNLAKVTDKTIIVPGHGPVGRKADLTAWYEMLVSVRARVAALKEQGRSLADTIAAKPTAEYDAKWGQFVIAPALFIETVYTGV